MTYPPQQGYAPQPQQQYAPSPQPAQPVDREIHGILVGFEPRNNGWHRFMIMEAGKQYPTKADTKHTDVISQALGLVGQPVAAQVREEQSNTLNPHNNRPYTNRYLNAIAPEGYTPGVAPAQGAPTPQAPQPQQQQWPQPTQSVPVPQFEPGLAGMDKELNIARQCAAKVVAMLGVGALPADQRNTQGLIEAAEVWMGYFFHGPLRFGVTPFNQPRQAQVQPQAQAQPYYGAPQTDAVDGARADNANQMPPQQAQGGSQLDVFGAPMDPAGTPIYGDPGPQDGQVESLGQ